MGHNHDVEHLLRFNAARKSDLDGDKKTMLDAANEIARLKAHDPAMIAQLSAQLVEAERLATLWESRTNEAGLEIERLEAAVALWQDRYRAVVQAHEATIRHADREADDEGTIKPYRERERGGT